MKDIQLTIDRHSKPRAILIDESLLFNESCRDYITEIIDINELSVYYDTIILSSDKNYMKEFLLHNSLCSRIESKYEKYKELKNEYKFLLLICMKKDAKKMKEYYKCEILSR